MNLYNLFNNQPDGTTHSQLPKHICNMNHCKRCGECIPEPRILCDVCRRAEPQIKDNTDG